MINVLFTPAEIPGTFIPGAVHPPTMKKRANILRLFLATFLCVHTAGLKDAFAAGPIEGIFQRLHADGKNGPLTYYSVDDYSGKMWLLNFSRPELEPTIQSGMSVRITGGAIDGITILDATVEKIPARDRGLRSKGISYNANPLGPQNVCVMMLRYNPNNAPYTASNVQNDFSAYNNYLKASSYNQSWIQTVDVYGWYTISEPPAGVPRSNSFYIKQQAYAVAKANNITLSNYNRIVFYMDPDNLNAPYAGAGETSGNPTHAWIVSSWALTHELGHNLGLQHAHSQDFGTAVYDPANPDMGRVEYGNGFDVMGSNNTSDYNPYYKKILRWLKTADVKNIGTSGVYALANSDNTSGVRLLQIPMSYARGPNNYFYYTYLLQYSPRFANGVLIHSTSSEAYEFNDASLLKMPGQTFTNPGLQPNQTYTDTTTGVAITLLSADSNAANVQVTFPAEKIHVSITSHSNYDFVPLGTVPISARATGPVNKLELFSNGTLIATSNNGVVFGNVSTPVAFQSIGVAAVATGTDGSVTKQEINLYPVNDLTLPIPIDSSGVQATFISPANNATISGSVQLSMDARSSAGIGRVTYMVRGKIIGTAMGPPYSVNWNTTSASNGLTNVTAVLWNQMGDNQLYSSMFVNVQNSAGDTTAPFVNIASPVNGATVSGNIAILANASDNVAVARVELYLGPNIIGTLNSPPYSLSWNSASVADGSVTFTAKAFDAAGNSNTSMPITITVANSSDLIAPTIALTSPTNGSSVSGTTIVSVQANDNIGVTKVEVYDGSTLIGNATSVPFDITWNTTAHEDGPITLTAKAFDQAGNVGVSSPVSVAIVNSDTEAPVVHFLSPTDGATLNTMTTIAASASDNVGVTRVDLLIDGHLHSSQTSAPYSWSWDAGNETAGVHTLMIKALDAQNNIATASIQVTVPSKPESIPTPLASKNLFNPTKESISFPIQGPGHAKADIYNRVGNLVKTIIDQDVPEGVTTVQWDGKNEGTLVPAGVYALRSTVNGKVAVRKFIVVK